MVREARVERKTNETDVKLALRVDGSGKAQIDTGIGFLDHMLTLFAGHGLFDLEVVATVVAGQVVYLRDAERLCGDGRDDHPWRASGE